MRDTPTLDQLVCYAILMENNEGIVGKSPDYVLEKYRACVGSREPQGLLDAKNLSKLAEYERRWGVELTGERIARQPEGRRPPRGGSSAMRPEEVPVLYAFLKWHE